MQMRVRRFADDTPEPISRLVKPMIFACVADDKLPICASTRLIGVKLVEGHVTAVPSRFLRILARLPLKRQASGGLFRC